LHSHVSVCRAGPGVVVVSYWEVEEGAGLVENESEQMSGVKICGEVRAVGTLGLCALVKSFDLEAFLYRPAGAEVRCKEAGEGQSASHRELR